MSKLFEHIKKSIDSQPVPKKPDTAWEDFMRYKKKKDRKKPFPWTMLVLLSLLGLFLASNLYWMGRSSRQSSAPAQEHIVTVVKRDTVYIQQPALVPPSNANQGANAGIDASEYHLVRQELTYLRSKYNQLRALLSTSNHFIPKTSYAWNRSGGKFGNQGDFGASSGTISLGGESTSNTHKPFGVSEHSPQIHLNEAAPLDYYLLYPQSLYGYGIGRPYYYILNERYNRSKSSSLLTYVTPKTITLGLHAGLAAIFNPLLSTSIGPGLGLSVGTLFSKRIRGVLYVDRITTMGHIEDHSKFQSLPVVVPPNGGTLKEVYYDANLTALSLSMDYLFPTYWRIRPFAGLCYYYNFVRSNELKYEYYTDQGEVNKLVYAPSLRYNHHALGLRMGMDFNLTDHIDAYLLGTFQPKLRKNSGVLFYLSPGIYYHL